MFTSRPTARTVLLHIIKRKNLPPSKGFTLGKFEIPVIILASIWLVFELLIFRDSSFATAWLYVIVMVAIGGVYLLIRRGGTAGIAMPGLPSIAQELVEDARSRKGNA